MSAHQVFLAEDNQGDVILVKEALAAHHIEHQLHVARDGSEALDYVARLGKPGGTPCPDVILLDLNLPKVDGPAVLTEFRKYPQCLHTPVIVITSSDMPGERERMDALGVAYYFRKPSDLDAFMRLGSVVSRLLKGKEAADV
jgi:chemotaxis family two-component system response regulator Rcp1